MQTDYDIIIIGGGLVGASMAVALDNTALKIAVVEPYAFDDNTQPSYDERTVALTYSAKNIYKGMGIWQDISAQEAQPILDIHVSNKGHFGITHLSHQDAGTSALGYVVPTRTIGSVLHSRLQASENITLLSPATATHITVDDHQATVTIKQQDTTQPNPLSAPLTIIADGGRSPLLDQTKVEQHHYTQQALLSIVSTDRPHNGRAYERFTEEGPLALLPHSNNRYAVVWTTESEHLPARMALSDDDFIKALQATFGDRAGNFNKPSARKSYPLSRNQLANPTSPRQIIIGNAAHTVHPVAGQGFNLGLRDVATLADMIYQAHQNNQDIGAPNLLATYQQSRQRDTHMVQQFTHGLIQLFSNNYPTHSLLRNFALKTIEHLPPAKRFLLKRTMGLNNQQSTLARGLPLNRQH